MSRRFRIKSSLLEGIRSDAARMGDRASLFRIGRRPMATTLRPGGTGGIISLMASRASRLCRACMRPGCGPVAVVGRHATPPSVGCAAGARRETDAPRRGERGTLSGVSAGGTASTGPAASPG
ncbi:MAG TPA: hypothetical protein PKE20_15440, partial [Promineifilum sp.]|nr:hypothetical protein [Promineifilum sp.]